MVGIHASRDKRPDENHRPHPSYHPDTPVHLRPLESIARLLFKLGEFRNWPIEVYLPTVGPAECRTKWWHGPPEFGEQTDEVLAGFGFDARDIAALKKANVA